MTTQSGVSPPRDRPPQNRTPVPRSSTDCRCESGRGSAYCVFRRADHRPSGRVSIARASIHLEPAKKFHAGLCRTTIPRTAHPPAKEPQPAGWIPEQDRVRFSQRRCDRSAISFGQSPSIPASRTIDLPVRVPSCRSGIHDHETHSSIVGSVRLLPSIVQP